jgi:hypothetical protein
VASGHNGDKNDPSVRLEALEKWSARATLVILGGILLEIAALLIFRHPDISSGEIWILVSANVLIGIGLAVEYICILRTIVASGELQRVSDEKVAEANARASEANQIAAGATLELAKLQPQVAPRVLTKEQYDELQTLKGKVPAVSIVWQAGSEPLSFAMQISVALQDAGVVVKLFDSRNDSFWGGIFLAFPPSVDQFENPLSKAFLNANLYPSTGNTLGMPMLSDLPTDIPVILVGGKYLTYSTPPYIGPRPKPE